MSDNIDSTDAQAESELAGLNADQAAQQIHDDIRFSFDEASEYDRKDAELGAFEKLTKIGSRLAAHIPATTSNDPYLTLEFHLCGEVVVVQQRNIGSTDSYPTYVGDADVVLSNLAHLLEKDYF